MAVATDEFTMSQLGRLRWAAAGRRIRALVGDETVVDSTSARIVWEPLRVVGSYAVPRFDVRVPLIDPEPVVAEAEVRGVLTPDDAFGRHTADGTALTLVTAAHHRAGAGFVPRDVDLADFVVIDWDAVDHWFEEEKKVFGHPHDPFQRIETFPTSRHLTVSLDGVLIAESVRPTLLLETHLPPRHYLPPEDVRIEHLEESVHTTFCAYKGRASYWSVRVGDRVVPDAVWTYREPLRDGEPVQGLLAFFDERFDVTVDGVPTSNPRRQWS